MGRPKGSKNNKEENEKKLKLYLEKLKQCVKK